MFWICLGLLPVIKPSFDDCEFSLWWDLQRKSQNWTYSQTPKMFTKRIQKNTVLLLSKVSPQWGNRWHGVAGTATNRITAQRTKFPNSLYSKIDFTLTGVPVCPRLRSREKTLYLMTLNSQVSRTSRTTWTETCDCTYLRETLHL